MNKELIVPGQRLQKKKEKIEKLNQDAETRRKKQQTSFFVAEEIKGKQKGYALVLDSAESELRERKRVEGHNQYRMQFNVIEPVMNEFTELKYKLKISGDAFFQMCFEAFKEHYEIKESNQ